MKNPIKVSELTQCMICPRVIYFSSREEHEKYKQRTERMGRNTVESYILKEISFNLDKIRKEEDIRVVIEEIAEEIRWIYKDELGYVGDPELEDIKDNIIRSFREKNWLQKIKKHPLIGPYKREYIIVSKKLNMSGSVDKLIQVGGEFFPCIVKTGSCPEYGVWRSDKVQLAAYAMLIEEKFGTVVKKGFVEYIREGELREVLIKKRDRAMALQMLKKVRRIKEGFFPEKGRYADCESCSFLEVCEVKKTLLSKLIGWKYGKGGDE
ncbi:MAG: CRISPR-associated protein Cas4 [Candidatus Methanospirareceae archaeon]